MINIFSIIIIISVFRLFFLPGSWATWESAVMGTQRGREWALSLQKRGRAGRRFGRSRRSANKTNDVAEALSWRCVLLLFTLKGTLILQKRAQACPFTSCFCLHRPQAREYLISIDPHNETILELIQSSLFTICLDETQPYSTPENYTNVRAE